MTVLAIDPGPERSAYLYWDGARVLEFAILPNAEVFAAMGRYEADFLAIEMIASYGMAVGREVFSTCVWIGRFLQHRAQHVGERSVKLIPRLDIKVHLCNSAKAKDANVRRALIDRFGAPGTRKAPGILHGVSSHCWSALAAAVCAWDRAQCGHYSREVGS